MKTVEEVKAAAAELSSDEQFQLLKWLSESERLQRLKLDELRREISAGLEEADRGDLADGKAVFQELRQKIDQQSRQMR